MALDFRQNIEADIARVRALMEEALSTDIALLNETNRSILLSGGKFLRPSLAILVAKACSGGYLSEDTYRYAAASELLHNATLLHDDVADGSAVRRGVPTVMSLLGPAPAVLLGDYWLVKAMELILSGTTDQNRVIRIFARTLSDLAEGEMLQLQKASSGDTTVEDYKRIIYSKTASLFVASALSAAISVGVPKEHEQAVAAFAEKIGMAFQVRDDILDYEGGPSLGKPVGQDLSEQKITLPLLGAFEAAPAQEARIRKMICEIAEHPEYQEEIVAYVLENKGCDRARELMRVNIEEGITALGTLPDNQDRRNLVALAEFFGKRNI